MWMPLFLSYSALACAKLEQFDDAWRFMGEAMTAIETTKEKWCEAEIHRMAGEIALLSSEPDEGKAEAYFNNALAVARAQQAKSWELRAAMSSPSSGATRARCSRLANCSLRCTAGSAKGSTRAI